MERKLVCLQVHNDYQIPGGETKTAESIANLLERNGIIVIRYYKSNNEFVDSNKLKKMQVGLSSLYNFSTVSEIKIILEKNHVDFALVHNVMPVISNSIYAVLIKRGIPIIKYIQNYNLICLNGALNCGMECERCKHHLFIGVKNRCYKGSKLYSLIKYIVKRDFDSKYLDKISAFMPNSYFVKEKHVQYGIDASKMYVMHNYIVESADQIDIDEKSYYLYFGRISIEKGIFTVIKAFALLPECELVVMGSGELQQDAINYVKNTKLMNIRFLGSKKRTELNNVIRKAKCVIVSSEWDEPLPRTILEAYSQGTPVIGALRGGIPEMIKDGITGYTYQSGSVEKLIHSIMKMNSLTEEEYALMCQNAKHEIGSTYTEERYIERFMKCVGEIRNDEV